MNKIYHPVSLTDIERYRQYAKRCKTFASDYSFANIWGWAPHFNLQWRFDEQLCWIKQEEGGKTMYWAPIGAWQEIVDWTIYPEMTEGNTFTRVPEMLAELWRDALPGRVHLHEQRGQWDYVYLASDLMQLAGNRFHKKKNLVRQFEKKQSFEYRSISASCVETVLKMQHEWCQWRDCLGSSSLLAENDAVSRILTQWGELGDLCGGIIRIDGKPIAYTLAEPLTEEMMVIHFEKAAPDVKGAYQAINYYFANDQGKNYRYINREQDLDDEGLRKAKLSYNPVDFVKKYQFTLI